MASGLRLRVSGLGLRFRVRVSGLGLRFRVKVSGKVSGLGFGFEA